MADLTLYHASPSRSSVALWMLEELGEPYDIKLLSLSKGENRMPDYLAINPMGKVPALKHHDTIITEVAAICCYLADAFPEAKLAPAPADRGLLSLDLLHLRPGRGGIQQQGRRLGTDAGAAADVRVRQLRPGDRHA